MRELKSCTSNHFNDTSGVIQKFGWQDGYGAFTVSKSQQVVVTEYIDRQAEHHAKEPFQQEYIRLLTLNEVEYDERYIWD